jgi:hypothetical protein
MPRWLAATLAEVRSAFLSNREDVDLDDLVYAERDRLATGYPR